jgi:hypothetical protein
VFTTLSTLILTHQYCLSPSEPIKSEQREPRINALRPTSWCDSVRRVAEGARRYRSTYRCRYTKDADTALLSTLLIGEYVFCQYVATTNASLHSSVLDPAATVFYPQDRTCTGSVWGAGQACGHADLWTRTAPGDNTEPPGP